MQKYQNKKAAAQLEFLIALILLLVITFIIIYFFDKTAEVAEKANIATTCRSTIELNAIGHISGMQLYDAVKCPVEYTKIDETDPDKLKKTVADSLASCWYRMGQGQYEVFPTPVMTKKQYCVICNVLEFNQEQKITGVVSYMNQNHVPVLYTNGETISYTDYLQNFHSDPSIALLYTQETRDTLDTKDPYATIFLYGKKGYINRFWGGVTGAGTGFATGAILIMSGVGAPAGIFIAGTTVVGTIAGVGLGSSKTADWESAVGVYPYTTSSLDSLGCEVLPAEQQNT
ncbi:hypothetical protein HZA99_05495 [Candidatus Woesearchaeota archaeon]|nr:hypothetical protein [Candidatus Woesearchaeota archaeon]